MKRWFLAACAALLVMGCSQAEDKSGSAAATASKPADAKALIRARLTKDFPDLKDVAIEPSVIPGMYEITSGALIGYVSSDAKFLIEGELVDLDTKKSLTEIKRSAWRRDHIEKLGADNMLVYEPSKTEYTVTVFTDPQCGYCKKFQSQIDDYLKEGIRVRYVFVPIFGDKSHQIAEQVWCAKSPQKAYSDVMAGQDIGAKPDCKTPLDAHAALGNDLGIRGTPAIVTEEGRMLRGYMPPKALKAELAKKL